MDSSEFRSETAMESRLALMRAEWRELHSQSIDRWNQHLQNIQKGEERLRDAGRWRRGRRDFLGVLGRHRDELTHSRMIEWLLDPCGHHGLGTHVLAGVLAAVGVSPGNWPQLARVRTRREVLLE